MSKKRIFIVLLGTLVLGGAGALVVYESHCDEMPPEYLEQLDVAIGQLSSDGLAVLGEPEGRYIHQLAAAPICMLSLDYFRSSKKRKYIQRSIQAFTVWSKSDHAWQMANLDFERHPAGTLAEIRADKNHLGLQFPILSPSAEEQATIDKFKSVHVTSLNIDTVERALMPLAKLSKNPKAVAFASRKLGRYYLKQGQYEKVIDIYRRVLTVGGAATNIGATSRTIKELHMGEATILISKSYEALGQFDKALAYLLLFKSTVMPGSWPWHSDDDFYEVKVQDLRKKVNRLIPTATPFN